jgi:hypothetical protein
MWEAFDGVRSEWSRACAAMEKQALANAGEIEMTCNRGQAIHLSISSMPGTTYSVKHSTNTPFGSTSPPRGNMSSMKLLNDALRHALLRRRITSEKLELSATLFDQDLQRFDADPASVRVVVSLLHQPRPWHFVRELACRQRKDIFNTASAHLPR